MINEVSDKLSIYLKTKYPKELPSLSIVRYSIKFLIANITPVVFLIISSLVFRRFSEVLVALVGFSVLRMFSGGYHIKSADICVVASIVTIYLIVVISPNIVNIVKVIDLISIVLVVIYAPSNINKQTRIKEKYYIYLKIISVFIVAINLIIQSEILTVAFFIQSISLIRVVNSEKEVIRNAKDE